MGHSSSLREVRVGQELKAETLEEHCLLAHSQAYAQLAFLYNSRPPAHGMTTCPSNGTSCSGLGPLISIKAIKTIPTSQSGQGNPLIGTPFSYDSRLCQLKVD